MGTYTITQTCATPSGALPEHFTTTTKVCDACAGKPTLTVTCPIETAAATATGNATSVVAVPTGTAGCGSGGSCPAGGNGTVIYVTAGAEGRFVTGLEVLVLGAMWGRRRRFCCCRGIVVLLVRFLEVFAYFLK